jgi:polyisoprenoid-binding protein YceI
VATKTYNIDKSHTEVTFQVRHLVTRVRGRFSDFAGTLQYDDGKPENSAVTFTIQAASIDTNEPQRDGHLRSADFFEVEKHPTITFASKRVAKKGGDTYDVVGDLTIRGVTKEVTLPVTHLGAAKDPWGNNRLGFEAELTVNRKDYGLTWNAALETGGFLVGDDVKIGIQAQAVEQAVAQA